MCKTKLVSKSDLPTKQSECGWSPERLPPPLHGEPRPKLSVSTSKCYRWVSPRPLHLQPQWVLQVQNSGVPILSKAGPGEGLFQAGETESAQ